MILSIVFSFICVLSVFLGTHALSLNPKAQQSRVFFALAVALAIWAFGFSIAVMAPDQKTCLKWWHIAAFGWCPFFGILLHSVIVFTGHKIKKWWAYPALYTPALAVLAGFTFIPGINPEPFAVIRVAAGWVNVPADNAWNWFYFAYCLIYTLLSLILVLNWGKHTKDLLIKRQVRFIALSLFAAIIISALTDLFGNALFSLTIPQMAPLYMAFPVFLMFFNKQKYGLLNGKPYQEDDSFITNQRRGKIFNFLFIALIAGAIVNVIIQYFIHHGPNMAATLLFSLVLLIFGFLFFIVIMRENQQKIRAQKLISGISKSFIAVNQPNFFEKAGDMLNMTGLFFRYNLICLYFFDPAQSRFNCFYQWHPLDSDADAAADMAESSWITEHMLNNKPVIVHDTAKLTGNQTQQVKRLLNQNVRSLIAIPVITMNIVHGFFIAAYTAVRHVWNEHEISAITIISSILANAVIKTKQEKEISNMAFYDYLTGLPNQLLFKDRLSQAIELVKRTGKALAVMFLDLDSFKSVNDTIGHQAGDRLLVKVSEILRDSIRKTDTVSRFGGDEFLILINHMSALKDTILVANKIMDVFNKPFPVNEQEFYITASAGIAIYPMDGNDADTLIKNADIAMYKAKEKGNNKFELCSPNMKEAALLKMELTNSLYRALDRNELFLHYQPQINLATQKVVGAEALLRWQHPEMGLISPGLFIPLAEQTGLIDPIGSWVLRTACRQNKAWQDMGLAPIRIAVNISVIQFRNPNLVSQVKQILSETGLEPRYLDLEITESVANNESTYIIDVLSNLKDLGVTISIDDFGTEYSSLNRLKILPVDRIKMDMQFVRGINVSDKDKAIANVIINLAHNLGLKIIAEGVENIKQLKFLHKRMCNEVQGYYFYKPLSEHDMESVLKDIYISAD